MQTFSLVKLIFKKKKLILLHSESNKYIQCVVMGPTNSGAPVSLPIAQPAQQIVIQMQLAL